VYVVVVVIGLKILVQEAPVYEDLDRQQLAVAGYVDWKEYRISGDKKTAVITLKDAVVLQDDNEKLPREDAEGIEGVLCYMEQDDMPPMGSYVVVRGTFYAFTHATNPGEFDSAEYYRILNQQGRLMQAECTDVSTGYDRFREKLYQVREYLSLLLDACYDEQDASVMKAMLLGEKGTLDKDIKSLYQQNGIIHILAISGLHLSVIGMGLYKLLRKIRCPMIASILLSVSVMYCYGTMTGMGSSMTRAYIMFVLHLCAALAGRTYDIYTALIIAALSILVKQPLYLCHSGFLFSFGAVCGIGLFLPAVKNNFFLDAKTLTGKIERLVLSGAAISISTLPVYLYYYYEFPPYSVLLNLLVIPCMTFVLAGGLLTIALAAIYLPLGTIAALPSHLLLTFYEKSCDLCMNLPGHSYITGCPGGWQVVAFLAILIGLVVWEKGIPKLLFWQCVLCALCLLTVKMPWGLEITMLDVGQGDCIYLSEDNGTHFLIDGGSSSKSSVETYQILPFLKYRGAAYLDAVFITHPDSDHENGIRAWLEAYEESGIQIGMLVLPDVAEGSRNEDYQELEALAVSNNIPVHYISAGESICKGKVMLTCINPEKDWSSEDTNACSIVLRLTYGDFSALFTGDVEGEGEEQVLHRITEENITSVTLLKVAHHGSKYSTSEAFLRAVSPKIALISAGKNNSYGHPHTETLEKLKANRTTTFVTSESGAITLYTDGKKVQAERFAMR
jgi:competence protein ComEC